MPSPTDVREFAGRRLIAWGEALLPSVSPGPAMGSWTDQWDRVLLALKRVEQVYDGRTEPEGTAGASYDVFTLFVTSHHLVDWIRADDSLPKTTRNRVRSLVRKSTALKVGADLANRSKHSSLTSTATGDTATGTSGNDVAITIGGPTSHAFRVTSNGIEYDARDLARACVDEWKVFLQHRGLIRRGSGR